MSSLLLTSRSSFRVATTVPTTLARIMSMFNAQCSRTNARASLIEALDVERWSSLLRGRRRLANRQCVLEVRVRTRDDVDRHELAHTARRGGAGVGRGLDGRDVTANNRGHVARA